MTGGARRPGGCGFAVAPRSSERILERGIAYGYLPVAPGAEGTRIRIEHVDVQIPARVAAEPLWDPKGERSRA